MRQLRVLFAFENMLFDTEYERNGTTSLFMFFNPIDCKHRVAVTDSRTAQDWAHQIKQLVDVDYPDAK
jgi:hypothetical protein